MSDVLMAPAQKAVLGLLEATHLHSWESLGTPKVCGKEFATATYNRSLMAGVLWQLDDRGRNLLLL